MRLAEISALACANALRCYVSLAYRNVRQGFFDLSLEQFRKLFSGTQDYYIEMRYKEMSCIARPRALVDSEASPRGLTHSLRGGFLITTYSVTLNKVVIIIRYRLLKGGTYGFCTR